MTVEYSVERDLRAIPAEKELLQLKLLRAVGKATDEGVPQRTIAVMLGVAQPEVSRIVKKLRLNPAARERSPREVMLEHAGGRISHEQMLDELAGWEYTFGQVAADDPVASRICGVRGIRSSVRAIFSPTRIVGCCSRPQRSGVRRRMHSDRVEAVAAQLEKMCRPGQLLDKDGGRASGRARDALSRSTTRMSIVERYLAEQTDVAIGRVILGSCDSGATGGGESSSVERRELAGRGWRVIDADRVKDHLLRDAYEQGFYDDLLGIELADGHRVMPRELATLVHTESTVIVDTITERCLAAGENIVLEGTFSWPGLGRRLLADLAEVDYQKLTILDVEAPKEITKARALSR